MQGIARWVLRAQGHRRILPRYTARRRKLFREARPCPLDRRNLGTQDPFSRVSPAAIATITPSAFSWSRNITCTCGAIIAANRFHSRSAERARVTRKARRAPAATCSNRRQQFQQASSSRPPAAILLLWKKVIDPAYSQLRGRHDVFAPRAARAVR